MVLGEVVVYSVLLLTTFCKVQGVRLGNVGLIAGIPEGPNAVSENPCTISESPNAISKGPFAISEGPDVI